MPVIPASFGLVRDDGDAPAHRPWCTWAVLAISLLFFVGERALLHLPDPLFAWMTVISGHGRLQADLGEGFYALHQLWTWPLFHDGYFSLAVSGPAWLILAGAWERSVGGPAFLACWLLLAPLTVLVEVAAAFPIPDPGLALLAIGYGGACQAFAARPRLQFGCGCFLVTHWLWARFRAPVAAVIGAVLVAEFARLLVADLAGDERIGRAVYVAYSLEAMVALLAGHVIGGTWRRPPGGEEPGRLHHLAAGEGDLDELEVLLDAGPPPSPELCDRLAERCVCEEHWRGAKNLADHLAVHRPDGAVHRRLRAFLGRGPTPQEHESRGEGERG